MKIGDKAFFSFWENSRAVTSANQAKEVPVSWITPDHHDVTEEMITYLKPLVAGEVPTDYTDGIADYLDVSHLTKVGCK